MNEIIKEEEKEKRILDSRRILCYNRYINETFDNNLDRCLVDFIDENNLEGSEISHWLRKLVVKIKDM